MANVELNLQTMFQLSGQKVDINKVKEATRILEEAKDQRVEKGRKLLAGIRGRKTDDKGLMTVGSRQKQRADSG